MEQITPDTKTSPDGEWRPSLQIDGMDINMIHAIGQLMISMASAEESLRVYLRNRSEIDEAVFDILTGELKSNQTQRFVKEITKLKFPNGAFDGILEEKLKRLSFLRDKRNQIAHWVWRKQEDTLHITKTRNSENTVPITLKEVREWADELSVLSVYFVVFSLPPEEMRRIGSQLHDAAEDITKSSIED